MTENKDIRVFFALWPDRAMRQRLAQIARQMPVERPARRVPDYNLHLTLHFIGDICFDELTCLRRQARLVEGRRFELVIDQHGHFAKPRIGWMGCSRIPDALQQLHSQLGQCLRPCGYTPETRPFNPHVTVARKMMRPPRMEAIEALIWKVESFALIESRAVDNGVKYEVVETYPIR